MLEKRLPSMHVSVKVAVSVRVLFPPLSVVPVVLLRLLYSVLLFLSCCSYSSRAGCYVCCSLVCYCLLLLHCRVLDDRCGATGSVLGLRFCRRHTAIFVMRIERASEMRGRAGVMVTSCRMCVLRYGSLFSSGSWVLLPYRKAVDGGSETRRGTGA